MLSVEHKHHLSLLPFNNQKKLKKSPPHIGQSAHLQRDRCSWRDMSQNTQRIFTVLFLWSHASRGLEMPMQRKSAKDTVYDQYMQYMWHIWHIFGIFAFPHLSSPFFPFHISPRVTQWLTCTFMSLEAKNAMATHHNPYLEAARHPRQLRHERDIETLPEFRMNQFWDAN